MKKTTGKSSIVGSDERLSDKLNLFFKSNNYLLALMMVLILIATVVSNSSFKSDVMGKLKEHETLLKKNLGKVHFLTAMGQHVVGEKMNLGYADPRFKRYLINIIIDNLVQGGVELTNNFKTDFKNGADIIRKNTRINYFYNTFLFEEYRDMILSPFTRNIYLYGREGRYPEYVVTSESKLKNYSVAREEEEDKYRIKGTVDLTIFQKSYIKELNSWDNREKQISIPFEISVSVGLYASTSNPFGLSFEKLDIPVPIKPTAADVSYRNSRHGAQQ